MAGLVVQLVTVLLGAVVLAGCISSSSRPPPSATSPAEAAQYNMQLGISYLRQRDYKAAQEKLERAIAADDDLPMAHMALGLVLERLGDPRGAEKSYRRAVALDDENPDAINALAVYLCLQKQEVGEALRLFDQALAVPAAKAESNRAMLYTNAGTCAKRTDLDRAEGYLRSALAADPQFRDALLQMAEVAFARGVFLQARAFVERFLAAGGPTPAALWLGYRTERALAGGSAASAYAERLKAEFPDSTEVRLLLESQRNDG